MNNKKVRSITENLKGIFTQKGDERRYAFNTWLSIPQKGEIVAKK